MLLPVFTIVISTLVGNGFCQPGEFDIYDYFGGISQSILRLYYGRPDIWPRQPKACYGVLVDWKIALFPCSCMSYPKDATKADKPWRHNDPVQNEYIDLSTLQVGTMMEEYEPRYGNPLVKISKYLQAPVGTDDFKCKSDYLFDWVAVHLAERVKYSTLIWFPTENRTVMRNLTQQMVEQAGSNSDCKVVLWQKQSVVNNGTPTVKYFRLTRQVSIEDWDECNDTVCPQFDLLQDYKVNVTHNMWTEDIPDTPAGMKQNMNICTNKLKKDYRACGGWRNGPLPICDLVPGTPVLCSGSRFSGGIIGTITNTTMFCPTEGGFDALYAPINLVAEAIPLINTHLRIKNAPGYDGFFTQPPKGPNQVYVFSGANTLRPAYKTMIFMLNFAIIVLFTLRF